MPMQIDQGSLPAGEPGYARNDGTSNGATVTLRDTTEGGTTLFEILWVSHEDTTSVQSLAATPADDHVWTFTPTSGVTGPIRIRLTHTDLMGNETREVRIFGIPDANGLIPPAPGERSDPTASLLNATDPAIIAKCERNWRTTEWPDGNPFGWALADLGGDAHIDLATPTSDGLMAGSDKAKLDGLPGPLAHHAPTHLENGADPIPLATNTAAGLMTAAEKIKLAGLGGSTTPSAHALSHYNTGGSDLIPVVSTSSANPGLMSASDKSKLNQLWTAPPAHQASHVTGADKIPVASATADGLMAKGDKSALDALKNAPAPTIPPAKEITLLLGLSANQTFDFPNIETAPAGAILVQQTSAGGKSVSFTPPSGTSLLVEPGEKLVPDMAAFAYTLYEYEKRGTGPITIFKRKLMTYVPPLPLPPVFEAKGSALWSTAALLNNSYTGPLFKVRRASDNTEMDIYPGGDGKTNEVALGDFCGSSQGFVSKLYDQGTYLTGHFDLAQTALASQPLVWTGTEAVKMIQGNVAMQFDGVDDFLSGDHMSGIVPGTAAAANNGGLQNRVWIAWKPLPAASMPVATPIPIRMAMCFGGAYKAWGIGVNNDRLYECIVGRGFNAFKTLANDQYSWVAPGAPALTTANTLRQYTYGMVTVSNNWYMSYASSGTYGSDALDLTSVPKTTMGRAIVPQNDFPGTFVYEHFAGLICHAIVLPLTLTFDEEYVGGTHGWCPQN